jgi:hypothetical protein
MGNFFIGFGFVLLGLLCVFLIQQGKNLGAEEVVPAVILGFGALAATLSGVVLYARDRVLKRLVTIELRLLKIERGQSPEDEDE